MASYLGLELPFTSEEEKEYTARAKVSAFINGMVFTTRHDPANLSLVRHVSLTLLPSPLTETAFRHICGLQTAYASMYHKAAHDFDFLEKHLKPTALVDEFVGRLWNIHEQVKERKVEEHVCLCLARNDFMQDRTGQFKQIEMNTAAAAAPGTGTRIRDHHLYMLRMLGCGNMADKIPESRSDEEFASALIEAFHLYGRPQSVIMFVIEDSDHSVHDQAYIEHAIYRQNEELAIIWRVLTEVDEQGRLDDDGRLLMNDLEVGLVYCRTGFAPHLYNGEGDWRARLMIEKSVAIKCPCIHTQLSGFKMIQQAFCEAGAVEKYVKDESMAKQIRDTFVKQYATDGSPLGQAAVELAKKSPHQYVLKAPRGGGGNNFFDHDIIRELERLSGNSERGKYVLMERVFPPEHDNYLMFPESDAEYAKTVSEIGFFTSSLWKNDNQETKCCGYLVKSKKSNENEGGIGALTGAMDSILLT